MAKRKAARRPSQQRVLNALPDTLDFRDRMFVPTLVEVPQRMELQTYRKRGVPILDQGTEGACTGFGLATVVHYLLRRREVDPDRTAVSPRMLYETAKRYDEWPGEKYEGSSARGAMKGWHKHGVCADELWPYDASRSRGTLTNELAVDAALRPLGAYFRVNHHDLVATHSAMAEVEILYATAVVHAGWDRVRKNGVIPYGDRDYEVLGGHAFAIVAYDEQGFWMQNSWGVDWGHEGFARISYDDWLENGTDVWVARLAAPIRLRSAEGAAQSRRIGAASVYEAFAQQDIRPHVVSIGNDGGLRPEGTYGTSADDVQSLFEQDIPRVTEKWKAKRLLLYAHGGLTDEASAIQRVADYRQALLEAEVYPLAFVWKTDFWTTLTNILRDALRRRRPEGFLDASKDFMLDRLDDALEPLARTLMGKMQWDEMKENGLKATTAKDGGARIALGNLATLIKNDPTWEVHVAGHSAGAMFHAPLVQLLTTKGNILAGPMKGERGLGLKAATVTLWAPACTVDLFKETYLPAVKEGGIERFALFTLTDEVEQDDHCASIYHKSLLYLVSNAFETRPRIPLFRPDGEPILGMQKFVDKDEDLQALFRRRNAQWVLSPNTETQGSPYHSTARHHGDFDDDVPTLRATLARILAKRKNEAEFVFQRSASSRQDRRAMLT